MEKPFTIIEQDDPNRVEIRYKDKGTIWLINTNDGGFIIDVYNKPEEECVDTMCIWDDDLENH